MTRIPKFRSEDEERAFWSAHDAAEFLPDTEEVRGPIVDARPKKAISLRMDQETVEDLKELAHRKGIGYQTLMRMWVKERLEREKGHTKRGA